MVTCNTTEDELGSFGARIRVREGTIVIAKFCSFEGGNGGFDSGGRVK